MKKQRKALNAVEAAFSLGEVLNILRQSGHDKKLTDELFVIWTETRDFVETTSRKLDNAEWVISLRAAGVTRHGSSYDEDGGWRNWFVMKREDGQDVLSILDFALSCEGYGGPGRPFAGRPYVRSRGTRTLVTQSGGLDI